MELRNITSRSITIYRKGKNPFYYDYTYEILVGNRRIETNQNVYSITGLSPDAEYIISIDGEVYKARTKKETCAIPLSSFHPYKDGIHDDTVKLQAAIMCCPDGGTLYIEKGVYLVSSLYLKSNITLYFEEGASLLSITERMAYPVHPGLVDNQNIGVWEGSEVDNFASVLNLIGVENVTIIGGHINSRADEGDWYLNHRVMNIAWRGHAIFTNRAKNIVFVNTYVENTFSWAIHPFMSENLEFYNVSVKNMPSMPTTDGIDPDFCNQVTIMGCVFDLGDDCIAIKSGTFAMAKKYNISCQNIFIKENLMLEGHGGVVLGSESSGGINNVYVSRCLFKGTDRGLRIKTRRGRGSIRPMDNIYFSDICMENVKTPFTINMYYNMGPKGGHEEYVWTKKKLPKTELTPEIGRFKFTNMVCHNVSYAAGVFLGLPESPILGIELENVLFTYKEDAEEGYPVMIEHNIPMKKRGLCYLNVNELKTTNVTFKGICGEEIERME